MQNMYRAATEPELRIYGYGAVVCNICGHVVMSSPGQQGMHSHAGRHEREGKAVIVPEQYFIKGTSE